MARPSASTSAAAASNGAAKRKRNVPAPAAKPSSTNTTKTPTTAKGKSKAQELHLGESDDQDAAQLDLESDDDDLQAGDASGDESQDGDEFPEIDLEESEGEADSDAEAEQPEQDDDADDESIELRIAKLMMIRTRLQLLGHRQLRLEGDEPEDDLEYDSAEEDDRASAFAARSDASQTSIDEELSRMVSRYASKPDEESGSLSATNKLGIPRNQAAQAFDLRNRNPDGSAKGVFKRSDITGEMKRVYPEIQPEYDSDSSTEDAENRIGNVPLEWYDDMPHIGYDINGRKVMKPATKDELDRFLDTVDGDGEAWFSARDNSTGKDVRLTDEELAIIRKLQNAEIPDDAYDPYEDYVDWFTGEDKVMQTALTGRPEPKSRFVPSKWEHKKVMKIVRAIRDGRIVPGAKAQKDTKPKFYNIWADADENDTRSPWAVMAAPKLALPGHAESYNPARGVPVQRAGAQGLARRRGRGPQAELPARQARLAPPRACVPELCAGALRALPRPVSGTAHDAQEARHPQPGEPAAQAAFAQGAQAVPHQRQRRVLASGRQQGALSLGRPYGQLARHRWRRWTREAVGCGDWQMHRNLGCMRGDAQGRALGCALGRVVPHQELLALCRGSQRPRGYHRSAADAELCPDAVGPCFFQGRLFVGRDGNIDCVVPVRYRSGGYVDAE